MTAAQTRERDSVPLIALILADIPDVARHLTDSLGSDRFWSLRRHA